jgi:hypothetical protein
MNGASYEDEFILNFHKYIPVLWNVSRKVQVFTYISSLFLTLVIVLTDVATKFTMLLSKGGTIFSVDIEHNYS